MSILFEFTIPVITTLIGTAAIIFLINGIDHLVIDVTFAFWRLYRRLVFMRQHRQLSEKLLDPEHEKLAAIMVPAWQEDKVIGQMLERSVRTLKYDNYRIFVGVYPNDAKTKAAVKIVQDLYPDRIATITLDHDGPTTKADCLNGIVEGIWQFEKETGQRFAFFVFDDAEDQVPQYELKVLNHMIPRKHVVQLAVFPLKMKWWQFTAAHYMDEFAQLHLKDMRVREWLTGMIPSAGVGTGFSRHVIEIAWKLGKGKIFNDNSLTEDYEFPLTLGRFKLGGAFVDTNVAPRFGYGQPQWSYEEGSRWARQIPAIRSAFPDSLSAAIRQKSRWIVGISLQGWEHLGWHGSLAHRYMLLRDRAALLGNITNAVGYLIVLITLGLWIARYVFDGIGDFPEVVPAGSWIWNLLIINFYIMCFDLISRAAATFMIYGLPHALLSIPRAIWGNIINFLATIRALKIYFAAKRRHQVDSIPWEKTEHKSLG